MTVAVQSSVQITRSISIKVELGKVEGFLKRSAQLRQMLTKYLKVEHLSSLATDTARTNQL